MRLINDKQYGIQKYDRATETLLKELILNNVYRAPKRNQKKSIMPSQLLEDRIIKMNLLNAYVGLIIWQTNISDTDNEFVELPYNPEYFLYKQIGSDWSDMPIITDDRFKDILTEMPRYIDAREIVISAILKWRSAILKGSKVENIMLNIEDDNERILLNLKGSEIMATENWSNSKVQEEGSWSDF